MALAQSAAPAVEPITLAEAKAFLRLDAETEDAFVASLITTSRLHIEAALGLALITQSFTLAVKSDPRRTIQISVYPLQSVDAIRVSASDGVATDLDLHAVEIDAMDRPARVVLPAGAAPSSCKVEVDFTAGFGDAAADVPEPIRHALLLLIAHWYENREPVSVGSAAAKIPAMISELLAPYREVKL